MLCFFFFLVCERRPLNQSFGTHEARCGWATLSMEGCGVNSSHAVDLTWTHVGRAHQRFGVGRTSGIRQALRQATPSRRLPAVLPRTLWVGSVDGSDKRRRSLHVSRMSSEDKAMQCSVLRSSVWMHDVQCDRSVS